MIILLFDVISVSGLSHVADILVKHKNVHNKTAFKKLVSGYYNSWHLPVSSWGSLVQQGLIRYEYSNYYFYIAIHL